MATWELMLTVFQVDAGNCIFIRTPSRHYVMVDCGTRSGWSPAEHIYINQYDGFRPPLEWLIITHPHNDHLKDIENVDLFLEPRVLTRPRVKHSELPDGDSALEYYKNMDKRYNAPGTISNLGCTVRTFTVPDEAWDDDLNTTSIVTFWEHRGYVILLPGDMSVYGWKWLLDNGSDDFKEWLKAVDILVAPHHGRKSCFCGELFDYMSPQLTIISDGPKKETDGRDLYAQVTRGMVISDNGQNKNRKVVTTRWDGRVKIGINDEGRLWVQVLEPVS